jgi:hypothetical protein
MDGCLNLILENCTEQDFGVMTDVFVRGNNVQYITPLNSLKSQPKQAEEVKQAMN